MKYQVIITPKAEKQIRKLPKLIQERILAILTLLEENPRPNGSTKLKGSGSEYRVRTGDYRIIYRVEDNVLLINVVKVGHRREIYR